MGGQACVLYGAAEFSRDTDVAFLASSENLRALSSALRSLQARRIALPPFELSFLQKGHAVHFRSYHPDALRMRIDVMSVMRGVDSFEKLWQRRVRFSFSQGEEVNVLSLPDLVRAKKTQRDKDWPMIRRLIEADYVGAENPSNEKIQFWLLESRTPRMILDLVQRHSQLAKQLIPIRPLLDNAFTGSEFSIEEELEREQKLQRDADRKYWTPLLQELEELKSQGYESEEEV